MSEQFAFDVFVCYSSKDKAVVHPLAERLREDGLRVWLDAWQIKSGDHVPAKIEKGLARSRILLFCMSAQALGSDWTILESQTFRFRDPINKERRFIPLRLDEAPIRGSLAQFQHIQWIANSEQQYASLLEACRIPVSPPAPEAEAAKQRIERKRPSLDQIVRSVQAFGRELKRQNTFVSSMIFSSDGKYVLSTVHDNTIRLSDVSSGQMLRILEGHTSRVKSMAFSADGRRGLSGSNDTTVRLWDLDVGRMLRVLEGHTDSVRSVAFSADGRRGLSGSDDNTVRLWDLDVGRMLRVLEGHTDSVRSVAFSSDGRYALSGSHDKTIRLWDLAAWQTLRVLEGHTASVLSVAISNDGRYALSGSDDNTVRFWDVSKKSALRVLEGHTGSVSSVAFSSDGQRAASGSWDNTVRIWDVRTGRMLHTLGRPCGILSVMFNSNGQSVLCAEATGGWFCWNLLEARQPALEDESDQVHYINAKVLLVGDTSAGKTGLAHRLATGHWKPSDSSTVGVWSTQWRLADGKTQPGVEKEIWLWDFGGQADQRLINLLYMDRAALVLLLFNADQEDVLSGLRDWQTALRRFLPQDTPQFLVAGRIDTGFKASRSKIQSFARENHLNYYETSALEGIGCQEIRTAILNAIPWNDSKWVEQRTSPRVFKLIKDEILKLRDDGQILVTFKELRELVSRRLPGEIGLNDDSLRTVIGLLDGPGVVKALEFGTFILLQPEWVNAYAQAVIRTLRSSENGLGSLRVRSIAEGNLVYQDIGRNGEVPMKRLPAIVERVVLGEMERQLMERGLCLQQGDKLVFPSHCGRDRQDVVEHPPVFVSYAVKGFLDDIYATLVVKMADSQSFTLKELWRDAADFDTLDGGQRMGIKLTRASASSGDISVYFGPGVTQQEQVIFANYINAHLEVHGELVQRLRYYICPGCNTPKGNPQVLMEKLLEHGPRADTECDKCGRRFPLWDALEKKFASQAVREAVERLKQGDSIRLDSRRKGKLLALEVSARITSADQKCFEIPPTEDEGLDMELEFTDDEGKGTGKRLFLQLKAGNSYLKKRRTDGAEIFEIKQQRWVKYWLKQPHPVMLVVGTFSQEKEPKSTHKLEFAEVRWMEISSVLQCESENGTKPVKRIKFKGERLDLSSVRQWREKILSQECA